MATSTSEIVDNLGYRRQTWVNGNIIVVEEPRRRPPKVRRRSHVLAVVSASTAIEHDPTGATKLDNHRKSKNSLSSSQKSRRRESRAVVIESRDATAKARSGGMVINELTPPPTPRIERLPTPELPELDQVAFCSCCEDSIQKLLCGRCGREVELLMKELCNCRPVDANSRESVVRGISSHS